MAGSLWIVRSFDLHPTKPLYTEHHRRNPPGSSRSFLTWSAPALGGESRLVLLGHGRKSYYITHMFDTIMSIVERFRCGMTPVRHHRPFVSQIELGRSSSPQWGSDVYMTYNDPKLT